MISRNDEVGARLIQYLGYMAEVERAGVRLPKSAVQQRARLQAWQQLEFTDDNQRRLTDALLAGVTAFHEIVKLRQAALSEIGSSHQAVAYLANRVATVFNDSIRSAFREVVDGVGEQERVFHDVAVLFNTAAEGYTKLAAVVDPASSDSDLVSPSTTRKQIQAWHELKLLSADLDRLEKVLQSAARLAGIDLSVPRSAQSSSPYEDNRPTCPTALVPLVAQQGTATRRQLWDAYRRRLGTRGTRWSQILAAGGVIVAPTASADHSRYRKPLDIRRFHRRDPNTGRLVTVVIDPELQLDDGSLREQPLGEVLELDTPDIPDEVAVATQSGRRPVGRHLTGLVSDDGTSIANAYVPSPRARSNRLITGT